MIRVTDKQFWMDPYMISNLNTLCYNLKNDWDFVGTISGHGMTRVGKSVLAQQIGYYVSWKMKRPFSLANVVFSGDDLIKTANKLPPNSVIIYDEARAELDSKKSTAKISKLLQDFFAECGMLNHLFLLVLPNFFELNKSLATSRTEFLIDVVRSKERGKDRSGEVITKFKRGTYVFYNKTNKKWLYINGKKKFESYEGSKYNFVGSFPNTWVLDVELYKKKKISFLRRDREATATVSPRYALITEQRNALATYLNKVYQIKVKDIAEVISQNGKKTSPQSVSKMITR